MLNARGQGDTELLKPASTRSSQLEYMAAAHWLTHLRTFSARPVCQSYMVRAPSAVPTPRYLPSLLKAMHSTTPILANSSAALPAKAMQHAGRQLQWQYIGLLLPASNRQPLRWLHADKSHVNTSSHAMLLNLSSKQAAELNRLSGTWHERHHCAGQSMEFRLTC